MVEKDLIVHSVFCAACQDNVQIPQTIWAPTATLGIRKAVFIHGSPIHSLILYVNPAGKIISHEVSPSIQLNRDGRVLSQLSAAISDEADRNNP
jgi:hypothetical protein